MAYPNEGFVYIVEGFILLVVIFLVVSGATIRMLLPYCRSLAIVNFNQQWKLLWIILSPLVYVLSATSSVLDLWKYSYRASQTVTDLYSGMLILMYVNLIKALFQRESLGGCFSDLQTHHHFLCISLTRFLPGQVRFVEWRMRSLSRCIIQFLIIRFVFTVVDWILELSLGPEPPRWPFFIVDLLVGISRSLAMYWMGLFRDAMSDRIDTFHVSLGYYIVGALIFSAVWQPMIFMGVCFLLSFIIQTPKNLDHQLHYSVLLIEMLVVSIVMSIWNREYAPLLAPADPPPPPPDDENVPQNDTYPAHAATEEHGTATADAQANLSADDSLSQSGHSPTHADPASYPLSPAHVNAEHQDSNDDREYFDASRPRDEVAAGEEHIRPDHNLVSNAAPSSSAEHRDTGLPTISDDAITPSPAARARPSPRPSPRIEQPPWRY